MLKLPKQVLASPQAASIEALFNSTVRKLRDDGEVLVSSWSYSKALALALTTAVQTEEVLQGLELIARSLDLEQRGVRSVQKKLQQQPVERLSRLLLLTSDGSERFYRAAESILRQHGERTWGVLLDANAEQLGLAVKGSPAKAVMIADRKALEAFLLALAPTDGC